MDAKKIGVIITLILAVLMISSSSAVAFIPKNNLVSKLNIGGESGINDDNSGSSGGSTGGDDGSRDNPTTNPPPASPFDFGGESGNNNKNSDSDGSNGGTGGDTGGFVNNGTSPGSPNGTGSSPHVWVCGSNSVEILKGSSWNDPGAEAWDKEDGCITHLIKVNSNLDINAVGTYTIIYYVYDSDGNYGEARRTVAVRTVLFPNGDDNGDGDNGGGDNGGGGNDGNDNQPFHADAGPDYTAYVLEEITFDGSGSRGPPGVQLGYDWKFWENDNWRINLTAHPQHVYAGNFIGHTVVSVRVYAINDPYPPEIFDVDSANINITARENSPPIAIIVNGPYYVNLSSGTASVFFDGSGSFDSDNDSFSCTWYMDGTLLGNGLTCTCDFSDDENDPHHVQVGTSHDIVLKVVGDDGWNKDTTKIYFCGYGTPVAILTSDTNVNRFYEVTFDGSKSSDPSGTALSFELECYKYYPLLKLYAKTPLFHEESKTGIFTHIFDEEGSYSAQLKVTNANGKAGYTSKTINVNIELVIEINGDLKNNKVKTDERFTATVKQITDENRNTASIYSSIITFNGEKATAPGGIHIFKAPSTPGDYTITAQTNGYYSATSKEIKVVNGSKDNIVVNTQAVSAEAISSPATNSLNNFVVSVKVIGRLARFSSSISFRMAEFGDNTAGVFAHRFLLLGGYVVNHIYPSGKGSYNWVAIADGFGERRGTVSIGGGSSSYDSASSTAASSSSSSFTSDPSSSSSSTSGSSSSSSNTQTNNVGAYLSISVSPGSGTSRTQTFTGNKMVFTINFGDGHTAIALIGRITHTYNSCGNYHYSATASGVNPCSGSITINCGSSGGPSSSSGNSASSGSSSSSSSNSNANT